MYNDIVIQHTILAYAGVHSLAGLYNILLLCINFFPTPHIDITSELLLFNDSPQISGLSLTAFFILSGCAQVTCAVVGRTPNTDCKS